MTKSIYFALVSAVAVLAGPPQAQAQIQQKLNIQNVTVFLSGAELYSTGKVQLPKGESEVLFTNVAGGINENSLTIGVDSGVLVQSSIVQNDYLKNEIISPAAKAVKDEIEAVQNEADGLKIQLEVAEEQLAILKENRKVGGVNSGLSVTELQRLIELVNEKMNIQLSARKKLGLQIAKLDEKLTKLKSQLQTEQQKNSQPGGQVLVKFFTPEATNANITMSYVIGNAGWTPSYDLRVEKVGMPVNLAYKANIYQNSGVEWNGVQLTLSSGNPSEGAQAPTLAPWYLNIPRPVMSNYGGNFDHKNTRALISNEGAPVAASPLPPPR